MGALAFTMTLSRHFRVHGPNRKLKPVNNVIPVRLSVVRGTSTGVALSNMRYNKLRKDLPGCIM